MMHKAKVLMIIFVLFLNTACHTEPVEPSSSQGPIVSNPAQLNVNTASYEDLLKIDGLNKATAKAIIEFRKLHRIKHLSDLLAVSGIGEKTFYKIRSMLTVK